MKYKPYFLIQKLGNSFDLKYFNGRFMLSMNSDLLFALMAENNRLGEKFNCVVTAALDAETVVDLVSYFSEYPENNLRTFASLLRGVRSNVILRLNPQMAHTFISAIRYIEGLKKEKRSLLSRLVFAFEMNWKGADVFCDLFEKSENDNILALVEELDSLMSDLQERAKEE